LTSEEWGRVRALFEGALAVAAPERQSWIDRHAPDESVAGEVRELISCYEQWPDFLEEPAERELAPGDAPASPLAGRQLGPWRLVREIGCGGMGVVWEAVRDDHAFQQRVAVKLLSAGLQSASGIARFVEERQILANLSHPGIARLLGGGSMEDGSPYLVMEYVEGERLDEWLAHSPSLGERLRVFLSICPAVEYAHRRLIVHGDLKPANIMVTPGGEAILLDFGVAKLLDPGLDGVAQTRTRLFSPRFASPEQVRGQSVTTVTDVHALGVLLYLMLTGRQPFARGSEDSMEVMRAICSDEPAAPSAAPVPWRKDLRGELEAIVLQCLRKDPEERYRSVHDLSEDIAAWRDGRPVRAHRPGWVQRARKLVRRNRTLSAAILLAALSMIGGSAVAFWQAHQARQERQRAEIRFQQVKRLAHAVLFDLHDAIEPLPGSTAARRLLVQAALEYLRELEATGGDNRDLDWELAAAYMRVGDVQTSLGRANTGDSAAAMQSQLNARRLVSSAALANPGDERGTRQLLEIDIRLGDLYQQQGDTKAWREIGAEIVKMSAGLAARHPQDRKLRFHALWDRAWTLSGEVGRSAENLGAWRNALSAAQDVLALEPDEPESIRYLADCYRNLGDAYKNTGDRAAALESYRHALAMDEKRAAADPASARPKMALYFDLVLSGWEHHDAGHERVAVLEFERAARLLRQICASDPDDFLARLELAKLLITAAPSWQRLGREAEVIDRLREALSYLEWARARDPNNLDAQLHHGWALLELGDAWARRAGLGGLQASGHWREAAENYTKSLAALSAIPASARFDDGVGAGPLVERATSQLALCRSRMANAR
jgi:non-specific serine/threonine protein kinase/serine/threonine-protein kinase